MEKFNDISLNKNIKDHLYVQLFKAIQKKILNNEILAEEKLPPIRTLAKTLEVTNNTVVKAYKMLEDEGLVYKKVGSGTFVSEINYDEKLVDQGYVYYSDDLANFASGTPSEELFPVEHFKEAINYVLDHDKGFAFGYIDSKGDLSLRELINKKIIKEKFLVTTDEIQIISGAQQGIDIVAKALLDSGDCVLVESPTYTGAIAIFNSRGCRLIDIDILNNGIDFEVLEEKIKTHRPKLFFTMPILQNPTGYSYTLEEKNKILALANKYDFWIVEDDYSSELLFEKEEIKTLKALDQNNRVIYIKSFSKIFLPGLRLGYLIAPKEIKNDITLAKHTTDISTSSLIQKSFEVFLDKGYWETQVAYMHQIIENKFTQTIEILDEKLPKEIEYIKPYGGVNFWLKIKDDINDKELYDYLLNHSILVAPGRTFYINKKRTNFIRLSIASIKEQALGNALNNLCEQLNKFFNEKKENEKRQIPIL